MISASSLVKLLDTHAPWSPVPGCAPLHAWMAEDELATWQALEAAEGAQVPVPFYAVAWPGARAVASLLQAGAVSVRGARVLDIGCGSGLATAAAALAGAAVSTGADLDPRALMATEELARRHGVSVETQEVDPLADDTLVARHDVILGADLFYRQETAERGKAAVARWLAAGRRVLLADAGRPFFDPCGLALLNAVELDVPVGVEGRSTRVVRVYGQR